MLPTKLAAVSPAVIGQAVLVYLVYLMTEAITWSEPIAGKEDDITGMGIVGVFAWIAAIILSGVNIFAFIPELWKVYKVEHTRFKRNVIAATPTTNGQVEVAHFQRTEGWGPWAREREASRYVFDAESEAEKAYEYAEQLRASLHPELANPEAAAVAKMINKAN